MIARLQGRVRWILIVWIFIVSSVAYLDRVNISIASHYIVKEYHLSNIQLGYIFSAFVLGYALFQAPGGRVADRYGARWVIAFGTVWWAAFTSLATAIPRSVTGVVAAFICVEWFAGRRGVRSYPASNRVVAEWIPTNERGRANGLILPAGSAQEQGSHLRLLLSSCCTVTADIAGESAGSVSGVMNMGAQIGSTVTATLTPLIASRFGWGASFGVAAFLCGTGALAWLRVDPSRQLAQEERAK